MRWRSVLWLGGLLLVPSMSRADPARCDAVFIGPADECSLSGEWSTTVTARSEAKARKLVQSRLQELVRTGVEVQAERVAGTMAELSADANRRSCGAAVLERAHVTCVTEASLRDEQICIADLDDSSCYSGLPIDLVGVAWKVSEQGRTELCAAVEKNLVERGASTVERRVCQVACVRDATVRCVPR